MTRNDKIVAVLGVAAVVGLMFWARSCGVKSVTKTDGTVKTVTKDSIVYQDRPVPFRVDSVIWVRGKDGRTIYDTLWGPPEIRIDPADTAAILARFYEVAYYQDVTDSGRVKITRNDTVTRNRIAGRSMKIVFSDTQTTTTIVLRPPRRMVGYFGLSVIGSRKDPFHLGGVDFSLKTANDRIYTIGANIDKGGTLYGEVGLKLPIRLIKR